MKVQAVDARPLSARRGGVSVSIRCAASTPSVVGSPPPKSRELCHVTDSRWQLTLWAVSALPRLSRETDDARFPTALLEHEDREAG